MVQLYGQFRNLISPYLASKRTLVVVIIATILIFVLGYSPNIERSNSCLNDSNNWEEPVNLASHFNKPLTHKCTGYYELRKINFNDKAIRSRLCDDVEAYTKVNGRYPLCRLSSCLPRVIQNEVFSEAIKTYMTSGVTGNKVTVFGYNGYEYVTQKITQHRIYEGQLTTGIVKIMQTLPKGDVTFLDVGSNIGAYSLIAADAGFPTVAVDVNIRNLIRIQFSARDMGWPSNRLRVIWSFFHPQVGIERINFDVRYCNVGGALAANLTKSLMKDTVPVMTASADDLLPQLHTKLVVMKIDIELSERIFFENSERLLMEKNVVVVQMEWFHYNSGDTAASSPHHRFLVNYFGSRNYVLLSPATLNRLDPETFREWDALWVKADYVDTVRKSLQN